MNKEKYLTIGEVAKQFQLSNRTLRYYEEKGILKPSFIGDNGYRYYSRNQLVVLDMIRCFRHLDISVEHMVERMSGESDFRYEILGLLRQQRIQISDCIQKEQKRLEYLLKVMGELQALEECSDCEIAVRHFPGKSRIRFEVDSIDSEEEREAYFAGILSYILKNFEEEYPVLYGIVSVENAIKGNYAYSCIEYNNQLTEEMDRNIVISGKKIRIYEKKYEAEDVLVLAYDCEWEKLGKYYDKIFAFSRENNQVLSNEIREKWVMPRLKENNTIHIWGNLEVAVS